MAGSTAVPEKAAADLAAGFRGTVLRPGGEGYEGARHVWNAMIDRRPALIARCAGAADVVRAVNVARHHGLELSVRGGGHNVSGNAVCDGGLMIDLSPMKGIRVVPASGLVRAQAGCTWRDLDQETQAFGLATTGGVVPTTGIAGLTLGGGLGWLMRKHGLSCDNLRSIDLVTANGQLIAASAEENADLLWAARGGGGNFGVATAFEYALHPVGRIIGGMVAYQLDDARDALRHARDISLAAPDDLSLMPAFVTAPDGTKLLAIFVCWCGALGDGERAIEPLRRFGRPAADTLAAMSYIELQGLIEPGFPPGRHNYWKSGFLRGLDDPAIDTLVAAYRAVPSPYSAIAIERLGGAVARVPDDASAFSHRDAPFNLLIVGIWTDPAETARHVAWVRDLWAAMQRHTTGGVYVNYLGREADEGGSRVREAFGDAKYHRLAALKHRYDPDNLFRLNQNILPAGEGGTA